MKKLFFLLTVLFISSAAWTQSSGGKSGAPEAGTALYVSVKNVKLKASPGFFSSVRGELTLGERVTLVSNNEKQLVVRSSAGIEGYAPAAAFSTRRVIRYGAGVTATEMALAGKGFNSDLEALLRSDGSADYSAVDAMENRAVSSAVFTDELRAFLSEGRLVMGE